MLVNIFIGDTGLILNHLAILLSEDKVLQEIPIDYMGVAERLRDVIRVPKPLRALVAEIVYNTLRLKNVFEVRENASRELNVGHDKVILFEYSQRFLERIVDLLLASHSVNVFALNASISLRLLERLSNEYKNDPLVHAYIEDVLDSLYRALNECASYTSIPPRKLVDYYADTIEGEIIEGLSG